MITAVLFDLVDTIVEQTEESEILHYETRAKAIHESLRDDGTLIDWPLFEKEYVETRHRQMIESRETQRVRYESASLRSSLRSRP